MANTTPWPPKGYRHGPHAFRPTLAARTHQALKETIDAKRDTLRNIAQNTGIEHGWLRMFSSSPSPDPGVNKIETLYYYLTGHQL